MQFLKMGYKVEKDSRWKFALSDSEKDSIQCEIPKKGTHYGDWIVWLKRGGSESSVQVCI